MLTEDEVLEMVSSVTRIELAAWVSRGWVMPVTTEGRPVYREIDLARVRFIHELRTELDVDEEVLPAVLSLVDQVYGLRQELRALVEAVQAESAEVRRRILDRVAGSRSNGPK